MSAAVEIAIEGKVGICRINSPESRNAITPELAEQLIVTLERLDDDLAARCIVLTGTGGFFATGHDIRAFSGRETELPIDVLMTDFWARLSAIGDQEIARQISDVLLVATVAGAMGIEAIGAPLAQGDGDLAWRAVHLEAPRGQVFGRDRVRICRCTKACRRPT